MRTSPYEAENGARRRSTAMMLGDNLPHLKIHATNDRQQSSNAQHAASSSPLPPHSFLHVPRARMFKKLLAHQSNATPIRSSARRQLLNAIFNQYPALKPEDNVEQVEGQSEKQVGKVIVPEGVRSGTFETSAEVEGSLYYTPSGDPLWMTIGRSSTIYIPTLSLLALPLPGPPLPLIQIYNPLPPPLFTGAPLFLPAVRNLHALHLLPDVAEGGLVAFVASEDNGKEVRYVGTGIVVAVGGVRGAVERRRRNREEGRDVEEGKFCDVMHMISDHLWEMGSRPDLPTFTLPIPNPSLAPPPSNESEAGPSRPRSPVSETEHGVDNLDISDTAPSHPVADLSSADISTLLTQAMYQSLSSDPPSFPLPASSLYSAHVLPNRPSYIPKEQRDEVVIGKSEWKKLAKWIKELSKEGVLKIKESKGEITVQGYDAQHVALQTHASFVTIAQEDVKAAKRAAREGPVANGSTASSAKGKAKQIEELWRPSGTGLAFWEAAGVNKSDLLPIPQLKAKLEEYISSYNLVNPADRRQVLLSGDLAKAVGVKNPTPTDSLSREEIVKRLRDGVAWSVSIDGVVKKGALQPILISVKTRQGRKTVTLISGLETFGIDIEDFSEELKKLCAGSTTIQPLQGASPKLNLREIMVQGTQTKLIIESLTSKGVPKRYIKEADGDKKKK